MSENIPLQQPSPLGPGILTVKLGWAYRMTLPEDFDDSDLGVGRRWRLYAIAEYERFRLSTEATGIYAAKGAISWAAWHRPFHFDVSGSPSSELRVSLFARKTDSDSSTPTSTWGDHEDQVTPLGLIRLNPFLIASDLQRVDMQNGKGSLEVEISYVQKETSPLETWAVWRVHKEDNSNHHDLIYVDKEDTGQRYGMKAIDISTVGDSLAAHGLPDIAATDDINIAPQLSLWCAIQHPFIAPLKFAFRSPKGTLNLLSPIASGGYLFYHLQRERQFDINTARYYAAELVCVLEYLHDKSIILGSLEPENILLDCFGHVSLCKPGIFALNIGASAGCMCPCTPNYPAPETIIHGQGVSATVDWWALGIILYEMVMGIPPFYHQDTSERRTRIINQDLQLPENLPSTTRDILTRLLNKDPRHRLGSNGVTEVKSHAFFNSVSWDDCIQRKDGTPFQPPDAASMFWRGLYTYKPYKPPKRERREHEGEVYENIGTAECEFWLPIGSVNKRKGEKSADKKDSVSTDSTNKDGWEFTWDPTDQGFYFKNHSTEERRIAKPTGAFRGRMDPPSDESPTKRQKEEALAASLESEYSQEVVSQILSYGINLDVRILDYDQTPDDDMDIRPAIRDIICLTPLEWAVEHGRLDLVNLFLENGADANFNVSYVDGPALLKAVRRKSQKLMEILVQRSDRVTCTRALSLAVEQQDIPTTQNLLAHDNVRCDFEESDRPLPRPIWDGCDFSSLRELEFKDLTPPLVRAARLGNVALAKLLLERGANPNVAYHDLGGRNRDGYYAHGRGYKTNDSSIPANFSCGRVIEIAMEMGHSEVVAVLLDAGADINIKQEVLPKPFWHGEQGHVCLPVPREMYVEVRAGLVDTVATRERATPS